MNIGLIGLPKSGKTTIFNALSKSTAEVTAYDTGKVEPNLSVVEVVDDRVSKLSAMYNPKKTTFATFDLVDFAGVGEGFSKQGADTSVMKLVKTMDALGLVVRNFADEINGSPSPLDDVSPILDELILTDMVVVENRLERLEKSLSKGVGGVDAQKEQKVLLKVQAQLGDNRHVRELDLSPDEQKAIRGFQLLTAKPLLVVLNSDEERFGASGDVVSALEAQGLTTIEFSGSFEMELSQLSDDEAAAFMEDAGITESARARLTTSVYALMGLISFFTVGEDEVRAWTITRGDSAVDAAGAIHSDLARGFIRAECFSYEALIDCGSEKAVKEKGLMRLEGKDYTVSDGDILSIRFNV